MHPAWWLLAPWLGYLLGSLPWAVWLVRGLTGEDVRAFGSGHAGATNVFRRLGLGWALLVLALDAGKGFAAVALARHLAAPPALLGLTAAAAVAGHNWPWFAHFRGGMGNAVTLGALLAVGWEPALAGVGWLALWALVWRHAARGTLTAAATGWLLFWALGFPAEALAVALGVGPVLAVRFAADWSRRYREFWLDRPSPSGEPTPRPRRPRVLRALWSAWVAEAGAVALLLAAGLRLLRSYPQVFDIGLFDETRYLLQGLRLTGLDALPGLYRGPLYALWYALLARWEPDPVALYDLNERALMLALPVALYAALRALGRSRGVAWALAWAFLLSDANLIPWPRVSAFAWTLLLAATAAALATRRPWLARGVLVSAAWLAAYARPEMLLAVALLLAEAAWAWRRNGASASRVGAWLGGVLLVGLLAAALLGWPLREEGRLETAFWQHFTYRWAPEYGLSGGRWSRWQEMRARVLGRGDWAAAAGPIVRHVARNALEAGPKLAALVLFHAPLTAAVVAESVAWGLLALLGSGALLWWARRNPTPGRAPRGNPAQAVVGRALVALVLPAAGSVVVIYPRRHYLLALALLMWLGWAWWLGPAADALLARVLRGRGPRWALAVGLAALALVTPSVAARFPCPEALPRVAGRAVPRAWLCRTTDTRQSIAALRAAARQQDELRLAIDENYWARNLEVYLPAGVQRTHPAPRTGEQLLLWPVDVSVLVYGRPWLDQAERRAALEEVARQGGAVYCTSGRPWILAFREAVAVPLARCP